MNYTYIECDCHSDEHVLRFAYDPVDHDVYLSVFLNHWEPWYKRVWNAVRYVFGYKSKYGHFDSTTMSHQNLLQLRNVCDIAIDALEKAGRL